MKDKLILSFYIDIRDIDFTDTLEYLNEVKRGMSSQIDDNGVTAFFIPIKGETKIECINPVLIMEEEAINNFNKAMDKLQVLNNQLVETIKENKKEDEKTEE